jgi:hypothetical protein
MSSFASRAWSDGSSRRGKEEAWAELAQQGANDVRRRNVLYCSQRDREGKATKRQVRFFWDFWHLPRHNGVFPDNSCIANDEWAATLHVIR